MPPEYDKENNLCRTRSQGKLHIDLSRYPPEPPFKQSKPKRKLECDQGSILDMRTRHPVGEKTHALVQGVSEEDKENIKEAFAKNVPTHRPVKESEDIPVTPVKGRPLYVETPHGTRLHRHKDYGIILIFSSAAAPYQVKQEPPVQEIPSTPHHEKCQTLHVTEAFLKEIEQEREQTGDVRHKSQNSVMNGNAKTEAKNFLTPQDRKEWLHLIAWRILGRAAQHPGNLAAGSNHANTDQMFPERQIRDIAAHYKDTGFDLEVRVTLVPRTHIAQKIFYTIKTPDFSLCFVFDAQNTVKPHISVDNYVRVMIRAMLDKTQEFMQQELAGKENAPITNRKRSFQEMLEETRTGTEKGMNL